jgi:hypothetical protein
MASICCWPPDRPPAGRLRFSFRIGNIWKASSISRSTRSSEQEGAEAQVFLDRQVGEYLPALRRLRDAAADARCAGTAVSASPRKVMLARRHRLHTRKAAQQAWSCPRRWRRPR